MKRFRSRYKARSKPTVDLHGCSHIIERIITTHSKQLNEYDMKCLKNFCKKSNNNLKLCFENLFLQLSKNKSETRYLVFLIMKELYVRSHLFRELLHEHLYQIFLYTVESQPKTYPLPLPLKLAQHLKLIALNTFHEWHTKYGDHYPKLSLGYNFLKHALNIDFQNVSRLIQIEKDKVQRKLQEKDAERENLLRQVYKEIEKSYNDLVTDTKRINTCFELLIPKIKTFDDINPTASTSSTEESSSQIIDNDSPPLNYVGSEFGLSGQSFTVDITINTQQVIQENTDNKDIILQMVELYKELKKKLIHIEKWIHTLRQNNCKVKEKIVKVLELHERLIDAVGKFEELNIIEEIDDGFEDVPEKKLTI